MTTTVKTNKRVKAHTIYEYDGKRVPSVTTVLGILAKPALVPWANRMGLQGIDTSKFVQQEATVGTIGHEKIECNIKEIEFDESLYAPVDMERANNAFNAWFEWKEAHKLKTIKSEEPLSSKLLYGGCIDWVAKNLATNEIWLVDFKTSKSVFPEMKYQVAAYKELWNENNPEQKIDKVHLLRLGKDDGAFEDHLIDEGQLEVGFKIFLNALEIYQLKKLV